MVMRFKFLLIFTLLSNAFADDGGEKRYLEILTSENPMFKSAVEIAGVKELYSECYKTQSQAQGSSDSFGESLGNCLWNKIESDQGLKKKVMDVVNKQSGQNGSGRYRTTIETKKNSSQGIEALKSFYQERLEAALYGEYDGTKQRYQKLSNQRTFFELYKTQLGKNIIASMTSYCIEADLYGPAGLKTIPLISDKEEERQNRKNINIQSLNRTVGAEGKQKLEGYQRWESCLPNINKVCIAGRESGEFKSYTATNGKVGTPEVYSYTDLLADCKDGDDDEEDRCKAKISYSNQRACNVIKYVELARQSIIKTDEIVEKMDKRPTTLTGLDNSNIEMYDSRKNRDESIDALTTLSSGEALEALAKGQKDDVTEMEKCYKDGAIVDAKACEKYLSTDKEEQYALLGELKVQQEATLEKLKEIESTPEEIFKLLKEEGYTDDQAKILSEQADVKEQVAKRFEAKKDAILKSLSEEIKKRTTTGESFDAIADKDKIAAIAQEMKDRPKNFSTLVHFNNIVSSFLEIRGGSEEGDEKVRNTAALASEMKNSFISQENLDKYKELGIDIGGVGYSNEQINERFAEVGMDYSKSSSSNDNAVLGLNDINGFIIGLFREGAEEE